MEIEDLWQEFAETRDQGLRNSLVEHHMGLARYIAARIARTLPAHVDGDDLLSSAYFGLIDAVDRFDHSRGVHFETYATTRIRGSILDEMRREAWAPKSVWAAQRKIVDATATLEASLGRTPTVAELAERVDMTEDDVLAAQWESQRSYVQELGGVSVSDEDRGPSSGDPQHLPSSDLAGDVEQARLRTLIARAWVALPDQHRDVLALRYGAGLTREAAGVELGVGRSKVTRLTDEACLLLREYIAILA